MKSFKIAAVHDPAGGARPRLDRIVEKCGTVDQRTGVIVLQDVAESATIAVAVDLRSKPPLNHATHENGSFAVIYGVVYDSGCDAGGLLDHYIREGEKFYATLNSAAALLIWDAPHRRLHIYRDRQGIVPSFFTRDGEAVLWSTDARTLLKYGISTEINPAALDFFLSAGFVPSPWSFAAAMVAIPAAHALRISPESAPRLEPYRDHCDRGGQETAQLGDEDRLETLFDQALRRQAATGERNAVLLSSGVDSKLVLAGLARRESDIEAFTFRYTEYDGTFNEAPHARRFAESCGVRHNEIPVRPRDIADGLDEFVRHYAQPMTFGLNSALLGTVARWDPSAVFSGAGADRWDLGEWDRKALRYRVPLQLVGQPLAGVLHALGNLRSPHVFHHVYGRCRRYADPLDMLSSAAKLEVPWKFALICPGQIRRELYADRQFVSARRKAQTDLLRASDLGADSRSPADRLHHLIQYLKVPDSMLYFYHCWSRAHDLTMRFPFLDRDFSACMANLPSSVRGKGVIRRLAARYMPIEAAQSPKIAQTIPLGHWFRGPLEPFLRDHLSEARVKNSGLFNHDKVATLIEDHMSGRQDHAWKLWSLVAVLTWQSLASRGDW